MGSGGTTPIGTPIDSTGGASAVPVRPCYNMCESPVVFDLSSGFYTSPPLGTGQSCFETLAQLSGGIQTNFAVDRRLFINGAIANPSQWSLPVPLHGGFCILIKPGDTELATFSAW